MAKPRRPGLIARTRAVLGGWARATGSSGRVVGRVLVGLMVVGAATGWLLGKPALERSAAARASSRGVTDVRIAWPAGTSGLTRQSGPAGPKGTWVPEALRRDLIETVRSAVGTDPFARGSLERARQRLVATGWFESVAQVRRGAGGVIHVEATWRVPAALVRHRDREYLVARGGEVLKIPESAPVAPGTMPMLHTPHLGPPTDDSGVVYGVAWRGGDVQAGIALIRYLRPIPEFRRVAGVDLSGFMQRGHLTVLTDAGSRIVWGTPPGAAGPGEVSAEKRLGRLRDILAQRADAAQKLIEIHTPVVLVDTTATRE